MRALPVLSPQRLITVLVAVLGLVVGGSAVALSVAPSTTVQAAGANLTRFIYASDGNPVQITTTSFTDVATTTITVPAGTRAVIDARFSATSVCVGPSVAGCFVRILIGGVEAQPHGVNLSTFDSSTPNTASGPGDGQEAHMIERTRGPVGAGTYVVTVQAALPGDPSQWAFDLVNWLLVVQRFKA